MKTYRIPFSYARYGRIDVKANNLAEAYKKAEEELVNMSTVDMDAISNYEEDSLEIDDEGIVLDENGNEVIE